MIEGNFSFSASSKYIQKFIEALQRYKYFSGGVVFTDYYSFDLSNSTISDFNQGGVYELVGQDSPIKYTKVIGYPLFFKSNYQINTSGEQFGLTSNTQLECLFISLNEPYTFTPSTYDLVVVRYGNESPDLINLLPVFRIGNIQTLPIYTTNNIFKLTLVPSNILYKDLLRYEQAQVSNVYVFDDKTTSFYEVEKYVILSYVREYRNKLVSKLENLQRDYKYKTVVLDEVI